MWRATGTTTTHMGVWVLLLSDWTDGLPVCVLVSVCVRVQFLILFITLVATFLRYVLYVVDARMDGNWPNKFTYLFYLELVSEIVKLVIYLVQSVVNCNVGLWDCGPLDQWVITNSLLRHPPPLRSSSCSSSRTTACRSTLCATSGSRSRTSSAASRRTFGTAKSQRT